MRFYYNEHHFDHQNYQSLLTSIHISWDNTIFLERQTHYFSKYLDTLLIDVSHKVSLFLLYVHHRLFHLHNTYYLEVAM